MQDMKRSKRRMMNQQMEHIDNEVEPSRSTVEKCIDEELNRGCKSKPNSCDCNHDYNHGCECKKHEHECEKHEKCEPCEIESDTCVKNVCASDQCCSPITAKLSTAKATPLPIETNRVFDTMVFKTFTDAVAPGGETLVFDFDVVEVNGPIPRGGQVKVTIDEVCMNFSGIVIDTGTTTLEDFDMEPLEPTTGRSCETNFEYAICGRRNAKCCSQGKGQSVVYKERGLSILVEDLVLELKGRCGCTKVVALAYPAVKLMGGQIKRCCDVEFFFNTLTAPICVPADGRGFTLRQDFRTNLTVDCIGKALLRCVCNECCESSFELCIPNDIDLIMCLESVVSTLMSEQIVVLGYPNPVEPRVVDTFNKVCDFKTCGETDDNNNKNHCGCNK